MRCRIDWKYALGMELTDPGFDHSVLSEFRDRMAEDDRADRPLTVMVDRLAAAGPVKGRGRQRTDSTHVLAAVRRLSRIEVVAETLRAALEEVSVTAGGWLARLITPEWVQRYGRPVRYDRLPAGAPALSAYVEEVGADGMRLPQALYRSDAPPRLCALRQVWVRQYWTDEQGRLRRRGPKQTRDRGSRRDAPRRPARGADDEKPLSARVPWASGEILSPYDPEARYSHKPGKVEWVGYKDHRTETRDDEGPNVIVHVSTTPAPEQDGPVLEKIHADLAARHPAPAEHLLDGRTHRIDDGIVPRDVQIRLLVL